MVQVLRNASAIFFRSGRRPSPAVCIKNRVFLFCCKFFVLFFLYRPRWKLKSETEKIFVYNYFRETILNHSKNKTEAEKHSFFLNFSFSQTRFWFYKCLKCVKKVLHSLRVSVVLAPYAEFCFVFVFVRCNFFFFLNFTFWPFNWNFTTIFSFFIVRLGVYFFSWHFIF